MLKRSREDPDWPTYLSTCSLEEFQVALADHDNSLLWLYQALGEKSYFSLFTETSQAVSEKLCFLYDNDTIAWCNSKYKRLHQSRPDLFKFLFHCPHTMWYSWLNAKREQCHFTEQTTHNGCTVFHWFACRHRSIPPFYRANLDHLRYVADQELVPWDKRENWDRDTPITLALHMGNVEFVSWYTSIRAYKPTEEDIQKRISVLTIPAFIGHGLFSLKDAIRAYSYQRLTNALKRSMKDWWNTLLLRKEFTHHPHCWWNSLVGDRDKNPSQKEVEASKGLIPLFDNPFVISTKLSVFQTYPEYKQWIEEYRRWRPNPMAMSWYPPTFRREVLALLWVWKKLQPRNADGWFYVVQQLANLHIRDIEMLQSNLG